MIAKELLSEMLDKKVDKVSIVMGTLVNVYSDFYAFGVYSFNIYELAHMCKEWARDNGYEIKVIKDGDRYLWGDDNWDWHECNWYSDAQSWADTEPEAIFKACQWILDMKKDKK